MPLFEHTPHPHAPRNANAIHQAELAAANFNARLAVAITRGVSTMWCAYVFVCLAILGFPALSAWLGPLVAIYVVWFSQTFLQLVFLPVLSVGQGVLGRKQEIQGDEAYSIALKNEHDIAQIAVHLAVQDAELLKQTAILAKLTKSDE